MQVIAPERSLPLFFVDCRQTPVEDYDIVLQHENSVILLLDFITLFTSVWLVRKQAQASLPYFPGAIQLLSHTDTRQPPLVMELEEVVHLITQLMVREQTPQVVTLDSFGALCFLCREGN